MKKVLITGPLGQDGKIITNLLSDEYDLYGVCRMMTNIETIKNHEKQFKINLSCTELTEFSYVDHIINNLRPDIIINLAGQTDVINPWNGIEETFNQNLKIPLNLLKSIVKNKLNTYFFQFSSSLMYARSKESEINENSCTNPLHPYGISKLSAHNIINEFRIKFGIKGCSGIFFNHESFYRSEKFLSKKLAKFVSEILTGKNKKIELFDLDFYRDISHAQDFMSGVKLIIDKELNEDFVFSSGSLTNMLDFTKKFFSLHNLEFNDYIIYNNKHISEDYKITGDNKKLKSIGWSPIYNIDTLILEMVEMELKFKNNHDK